ncbi:non-ribosomal peptide synthase/polyketide synthase [Oceanospirillum beijerinckii]|uniref:non-ribosomal peptide synthase/polyketide synthase n=1 Tax=Oceanospirillum beijerinckii TaxID=64976 RepID=UPI000405B60A|nr:non-ribosomal peptide synthetase [Oceanospirillum beijerinckii]
MTQKSTQRENIADIYPLSPLQQGMLFHSLLQEDSGVYIMQDRYRIQGRIDVAAFEQAWQTVVDTHPALRTAFSWKSQKQPLQIVYKKVATPLTIIDLRGKDSQEQDNYIQDLLQREQRSGFNMAKPPLIRFRLVQRGEDDYELVRSFHHILMDAWCISLILVDFLKVYDALIKGVQPELEVPRPFRDYIAWLQKQNTDNARDFWQQHLQGLSSPTPVPVEKAARKNQYGESVLVEDTEINFSEAQSKQLHNFCRQHDLTPNTFFQGVWALLLSRYSGQNDVLFGVTVSGRPPSLAGVEKMVGLFINSQPLRVNLPKNTRVVEWLKNIQLDNLEMREYEHTSLVDVQGWSDFPRGEALFDTLLVYENAPFDRLILEGEFSFQWNGMQHGVHTHYGLTIVVMPHDELELKISYDYARFDRATIDAMLRHMRELALAMIAAPDAYLDKLDLLDKDEQQQLEHGFNRSQQDFPLEHGYPELFRQQVARCPEQIVAAFQGQTLSFAELDLRTNRLGHVIAAGAAIHSVNIDSAAGSSDSANHNVSRQDEFLVALLGDRDLPLLSAMIATFKAGGAYLPLAPGLPDGRLQELFELSQAQVLVASESCRDRAEKLAAQRDCHLVIVEDHWLQGNEAALPAISSPERLAYVLFTSGSTGTPKGVMVEQRGMLNNIFGKQPQAGSLGLSEQDVIAQTASQAFDISVWQFLAAPVTGARVEILPDCIAHDPAQLMDAVSERGITLLEAVPAMMRGLLDEAKDRQAKGDAQPFSGLRWLIATGEALPPALANEWLEFFLQIPIMNAYGPAECSDDVAFHAIRDKDLDPTHPLPVGSPTANNQLYVLDDDLRIQPVGVPGEICVAGTGVGRGYWRDQERTEQVFIDHPFNPGQRFYRTGDLGRWLPDGTIEYLGRRDFQVKILGHRIELGEIENRLEALPQVKAAAVVAPQDTRGNRRLVAYWTPRNEQAISDTDEKVLKEALAAQLPEYMVPGVMVRLDALPLSANGKIDRKVLEAKQITLATSEPVAPRNDTERELAKIWSDILQREDVGVEDSFFALGGHSLLATRVMARIRESFKQELPLRTLFEQNTIARLAALIDGGESGAEGSGSVLTKQPRPDRLPLSFAQQRLWFLDQLEQGSSQYNTAFALRFSGPLDVALFESDLNALVARHPILRSRIQSEGDTPWLSFDQQQKANFQLVQVSELEWAQLAHQVMPEEVARDFELEHQAPIRTFLYQHPQRDEAIFLCVQHHAVTDGWSIYNLLTELAEIRLARRENRRPILADLPIDYVDFSLWQRRPEQQALFDQQLQYWEQTLGHDPYILELPTDRPRSQQKDAQDYRSGDVRVTLQPSLTDSIRRYAAERAVTPFTVMMASLHLLLGRYSGQQRIQVGTPVAGRSQPETHPIVGCFVNTLVIGSDLAPENSFNELVAQLHRTMIDAQANQDVPFERVVETLSHDRDLSVSPLFQVLFTMHQHRLGQLDWGDNQVEEVVVENRISAFDLCADVIDDEKDLLLIFGYRCALFDQSTVQRWLNHWVNLLEAVIAEPKQGLYQYNLLSVEERHQQLELWNQTEQDFQAPATLTEMLEVQHNRTPDAIAVEAEDQQLTYKQLHEKANRIAHWLLEQGVSKGVEQTSGQVPEHGPIVGICLERSADMVVAALAALKAGAAYLPLAPDLPAQRLQYMLDDAEATVVLSHSSLTAVCPKADQTLLLDQWQASSKSEPYVSVESYSSDAPAISRTGDDLAYVLYTSGSTGQPKGVLNLHKGVVNRMCWIQSLFRLNGDDAILHKAPVMFDFSVSEIFWALTSGARLVVAKPDGHLDSEYLIDLVQEKEVTTLDLVPAMLGSLLDSGRLAQCSKLRCVLSGGEALSAELVRRFQQAMDLDLYNLYGPTENAIDASYYLCPRESIPATLPIGKPLPNTSLYILDEYQNPVPVGVSGELCIGGVQLARGYLKRPDLTQASFIASPFNAGERLYRTGDRCRYLPDGNVEYLGRLDHQVKLRGQRIELGEIDACIEVQAGVGEAITLLHEAGEASQLVSYWVATDEVSVSTEATASSQSVGISESVLRQALSNALPVYMVPARFVQLDSLPLTRNGKIDRKALLDMTPAPEVREVIAPRTETERQLARIWAEALQLEEQGVEESGVEGFSVEDNFFALGGHSLLITRIMAQVRQTFAVDLRLRTLFDHPTVAAMAEQIDNASHQQTQTLSGIERPERLPLSYAQQRLWFLSQLEPDSSQYNMPFAIRFNGELHIQALVQAFADLVQRHEILRSRVQVMDNDPELIISAESPEMVTEAIRAEQWDAVLEAQMTQESNQVFDLATEAPIRTHLLYVQEQSTSEAEVATAETGVLLLTLHHSVGDDWSVGLLLDELAECYQARLDQNEQDQNKQVQTSTDLQATSAQYVDYSLWQRRPEQQQRDEKELAYWQETLGEGDYRLQLPQDAHTAAGDDKACDFCDITLSTELYQAVQQYAQQQGVTPFIVYMATLHLLLHRYSSQQDIRVGMPVAGRHHPETHGMIGCFVNTLVIRSQQAGDKLSFNELIQQIGQSVIDAQEHQDVPFERVVERLVRERDLQRSPLFSVMLSMEQADLKQHNWPNLTLEELDMPGIDAQFDLSFDLGDRGGDALLRASFRSSLFSEARIQRLLQHWLHLLEQGLATPEGFVTDFSLLTAAEQEQVLSFNRSKRDFPLQLSFAELFAHQVAEQPEKIVASCLDQSLSFQQLDQRSRNLALAYRQAGLLQAEVLLVAVLGDRGLPFLTSLVATLRSGGAYLPLDPGLPDTRLAELLALGKAPLLVTTASCRERAERLASNCGCQLLEVEEHWLSEQGEIALQIDNGGPDSLAYVLFTSGSTGTPKGVMVEQKGMLNNIFGKCPADTSLGLSEQDVIAQTASQAFDISVWQLLAAPVTGASVVILPDCIAHDPEQLLAAVDEHSISLLESVPAVIRGMLDAAENRSEESCSEENQVTTLNSLRWLLPTGEALPATLANEWLARFPAVPMMNAYGPAECADDVAFHPIRTALNASQPVPIGRPTANNELFILDEAGRLLPPGIPGEIGIGGVGVGLGYWQDTERTRQVFVKHPLKPEARFYLSGDLGRWREDGSIEYLGRKDFQVKVRGHRIEPGEIESRLELHPAVSTAAVVAPENSRGERQLVGYWVRVEGVKDAADLSTWLAEQLPAYMVPSLLVELAEMPLSRNGKIDRKALTKRPVQTRQRMRRMPETATELQLAALWQQLLVKPRAGESKLDISADDNFFALGGHSLLATRLLAQIQQQWELNLPLRDLFELSDMAALASRIDELRGEDTAGQRQGASLLPDAIERPDQLPLSFEQRRLWTLDQLEPGSNQYHVPFALKLTGALDVSALCQAFEQLAQRHEILRSRIRVQDEIPYFFIGSEIPALEVSQLADDNWQEQVGAALQVHSCNPFDLAEESPIRSQLLLRQEQGEGQQEAVLIITQHHIITDDWSVQILMDELAQCYAANRDQSTAMLPALSLQYADYSVWQQAPEQQEMFSGQLEYWSNTLGDEPYVLNLPVEYPAAAEEAHLPAGDVQLALPEDLTGKLRAYASQHNTTVFVVMMSALHALLSRYCNQNDVRVGTPVAGRQQLQTQDMLGCFVNTLVIGSQVDHQQSFAQLVTQVGQRVLEAQEHQDIPFERVVDALVKERDFERSPLFQVMLSMENTQLDSDSWPGLQLSEMDMPSGAAQFAQSWEVYDDGTRISARLYFDAALFESAGMQQWLNHWQQLLVVALAQPEAPMAQLDWLSAQERTQLLESFNAVAQNFDLNRFSELSRSSESSFDLSQGYNDHFSQQVQRHGQRPLVHFAGADSLSGTEESLSYTELDQRTNRLAQVMHQALQACNGGEKLVALLGERDPGLMAAMVATFKAGAAYMPLDPSLPDGRLAELLELSGEPLLVASRSCRERAQQLVHNRQSQLLIIEDHWLEGDTSALNLPCTPDDLAYVLFTSGSTGTPKGVMVEHKGMLNNMFGKQPSLGLGEGDVIAQTASQAFDISVWQFLAAPVVGAQVRILPDEVAHNPERLLAAIDEYGITLLEAVPAIIQGLLDCVEQQKQQNKASLTSLRWLIPTGEALPPALANRWLQRFPDIPLMNAYGPAECSDDVAFYAIRQSGLDARRPVPIGQPTPNNLLFILDDALRPQPIGVPGEICVAGVGVGRGYWRDEQRTKQAFIDHPFAPGERFYRTGDMGRWLPDGNIEYLGRKDFQVKVRGHRIEPGEIENRLTDLAQVKAAVVTAPRNDRGVRQLVAYWVSEAGLGNNATADTLREQLQKQLPGYMVPELFMQLDALPLNANGKVDRKALPRPETHAVEKVAAADASEALLCELIQNLLGLEQVWSNDNFFALGGDSILALQLVSRARQQGVTLTPKLIFQQRTIADLALAARNMEQTETEQGLLSGAVPLLPVQHWFFGHGFEQGNYWNQAILCQYEGELNATLVERVLYSLVNHHDALRLRFKPSEQGWKQYYGGIEGALRFTTLNDVQEDDLETALTPFAAGLDIQNGPISQAVLVNLANGQQRLYWAIHHLVIDTVSWNLLQDDFVSLYGQLVNGETLQLPEKTSSYRQWAQYWRAPATQARLVRQQSWWQQQDIEFSVPVAHSDASHKVADAITLSTKLDKKRTAEFLNEAQKAYRTRPEEMLAAALAMTLSDWSGQQDIRLDMEHNGRTGGSDRLDISRTVGWFASVYPLKLSVASAQNPGQTLSQIKDQLRAVPDHGIGYGALRYLSGNNPFGSSSEARRSAVSFEYFGVVQQDEDDGPLHETSECQPLERGADNHCEYELDVTTQIVDGYLCLEWTYGGQRDSRQAQQAHLEQFVRHLQSLIDHCLNPEAGQLTPSDFPMAKNLDQNTLNSLLKRFGSASKDKTQ